MDNLAKTANLTPDTIRPGRPALADGKATRLPPAIIVGGGANALSIARSLGKMGVTVYAINSPQEHISSSRYVRPIALPFGPNCEQVWAEYLLGPDSCHLSGGVLLAACDAALQLILQHRPALAERYRLDLSNPVAQRRMLNKLSTYQAAVEAGVPTPKFWIAENTSDLERVEGELVYPLIVKPQFSHVFEARFGSKFIEVDSYAQLRDALQVTGDAQMQVVLMEKIPGPDDRLCSYYTYLDERSEPLFHFTKRIIRRFPVGQGLACYHITDVNPEVRDLGLRLFRHVGLQGLANVEFKRDDRDGQLKLIECNARFTAANCLVARCGFDLARFVYSRLAGLPPEPLAQYRSGVRLWYPVEDFKAFLTLRKRGELTFFGWLASVMHRQTLPYFNIADPLPSLRHEWARLGRGLRPKKSPR